MDEQSAEQDERRIEELLTQSPRSHTSVCFKSEPGWTVGAADTRHRRCSGGSDTLTAEGPADRRQILSGDFDFALNTRRRRRVKSSQLWCETMSSYSVTELSQLRQKDLIHKCIVFLLLFHQAPISGFTNLHTYSTRLLPCCVFISFILM